MRHDEAFIWKSSLNPKTLPHDLTVYANGKVRLVWPTKQQNIKPFSHSGAHAEKAHCRPGRSDPVSVANRKGYKRHSPSGMENPQLPNRSRSIFSQIARIFPTTASNPFNSFSRRQSNWIHRRERTCSLFPNRRIHHSER